MEQQIIMIPSGLIQKNPAQMRVAYDLNKLAELTYQIISRGFDTDRPLLVRQLSNGSSPSYENIRGHRRRKCFLMSRKLLAQKEEWTLDEVLAEWQSLAEAYDGVEAGAETLTAEFGSELIPAVFFTGNQKEAWLALGSDNYGDEEPDALGVAMYLVEGIKLGIHLQDAAGHLGQRRKWVDDHLALGQVHPDIQQRISKKEMSISVAPIITSLTGDKREAFTRFILSAPAHTFTVASLKQTAKRLKEFDINSPLTFINSSRKNIFRSFIGLIMSMIDDEAERVWYGVCIVMHHVEKYQPPWEDLTTLGTWLQALGVQYSGHWANALMPYLTQVSCEDCPVYQLPKHILQADIAKLPCRTSARGTTQKCLHGFSSDDEFKVSLPMTWGELPGVDSEGAGNYVCTSFADLELAWKAQSALEDEETAVIEAEAKKNKEKVEKVSKTAKEPKKPEKPAGPSPIDIMRKQFASFIENHAELTGAGHFMATCCDQCQHKLDKSPTKNPDVPHCAWASHKRDVTFYQIKPRTKTSKAPIMPYCSQFAPERPWSEIIPVHPAPPQHMSRQWIVSTILALVDNRKSGKYKAFQWLTGRPMSANESYGEWFKKQFKEHRKSLSDGQLFALFILVHEEWKRAEDYTNERFKFNLPDSSFISMESVQLEEWKK